MQLFEPPNWFTNILLTTIGNPVLLSVFGVRVMLNLKIEGEKGTQQGPNIKSTLTGINFVEPNLRSAEDPEEQEMPMDTSGIEEIFV